MTLFINKIINISNIIINILWCDLSPSSDLLLSHPPLFVLSFFYPVYDQGRKTGISVMSKAFITGFRHNIIVEADGDIHGRLVMVNLKSA